MYVTPIRLGLLKTTNENAPCLRIKVNHVRENFIPNLEQLSLVFYKQNRYSCIGLILTLPILLTIGQVQNFVDGCQRIQNPIISRGIIV